MKANFWQILGVVLLVIGVAGYVYEKFLAKSTPPAPTPAVLPATLPATAPVP